MCKHELPLIPFSKLKDKVFVIPYQQRGYKWTSSNVEELLLDLKDFIENKNGRKRIYCLQPLAVVEDGENRYCVLDGQQRLTTLYLLHTYLYGKAPYSILYDRDAQGRGAMSRMNINILLLFSGNGRNNQSKKMTKMLFKKELERTLRHLKNFLKRDRMKNLSE